MQVKTSELKDAALDWAVAKCEGITPIAVKKKYSEGHILYNLPASTVPLEYSSKWSQGGPIIEREFLSIINAAGDDVWSAYPIADDPVVHRKSGSTPLIAAMRCYVKSKFGDFVEIPDQLR